MDALVPASASAIVDDAPAPARVRRPARPRPPAPRPALERRHPARPSRSDAPAPSRDVPLDLLRGLAMVILVVNHTRLESVLTMSVTATLSAAEVLVALSGVVVGMVFGRRWRIDRWATTVLLLRRARKLHLASVAVVASVLFLGAVPGLATDALTLLPDTAPPVDLYAFDGPWRTALAIVTLEAGPWQFDVLGLFVASLVVTPALLWMLARGWWLPLLVVSWALYSAGRAWQPEVLPFLSERVFPFLVWQVLYVHGLALGWHREALEPRLRRVPWAAVVALLVLALCAAAVRVVGPLLPESAGWEAWRGEHFNKRLLDPLRLVAMTSMALAAYLTLRRYATLAERCLGPLLLPLGRHSFYVFIMQVFTGLALASSPFLMRDGGHGLLVNAAVQAGVVLLLCTMVRRRFLFRWIPS